MDPINLLLAINLFVSMSANYSGAKKGLKTSVTKVIDRPVSYLQKVPPNVAAVVLILTIVSIFKIGTLPASYEAQYSALRIIGLIAFVFFSWVQVLSYKSLVKFYAQDVVVMKEHELVEKGLYRFIRHPQYLSQLLSDLGAGVALLSYIVTPVVIFIEIPLFVLRARLEEKILLKHFGDQFVSYKKRSGFMLPFIG
ncbi:MAG: isoprenylcysteine carboxylmethyltransferase family protein [Bacteroidetes bacterium]|nr:isoprenylcysteine carboxylmethyltransferase family protein [Bacteroidota bacterium]